MQEGSLDVEAMRTAAQALLGEHDFRHFCKADVLQVRRAHIFGGEVVTSRYFHRKRYSLHWINLVRPTHTHTRNPAKDTANSSCDRADTWAHSLRVWSADWDAFCGVGLGWMGVGNGVMHVS